MKLETFSSILEVHIAMSTKAVFETRKFKQKTSPIVAAKTDEIRQSSREGGLKINPLNLKRDSKLRPKVSAKTALLTLPKRLDFQMGVEIYRTNSQKFIFKFEL